MSTQRLLDEFTKLDETLTEDGPSEKWLAVRSLGVVALTGYTMMVRYARERTKGGPRSRYLEPVATLTNEDVKKIRAATGINRRLGTRLRQISNAKRSPAVTQK